MTYPEVTVHQGDSLEVLKTLPSESVHMCVTSPPYWGLRDYGVEGQIGLEPSVTEHLAALVAVFRECRRVMRKDATLWLNYGDAYACAPNGNSAASYKGKDDRTFRDKPCSTVGNGFKPKDLMMLPHRLAIRLQEDGWWVRQAITWCKKSPMPESVTDRCTSATEMLFMLTKSPCYYYDAIAIAEPCVSDHGSGNGFKRGARLSYTDANGARGNDEPWQQGGTKNKRNWWVISSEAYPDAHFSTFPRKLVSPCILAGTSAWGVCHACAAPFVRQVEKEKRGSWHNHEDDLGRGQRDESNEFKGANFYANYKEPKTTGWTQSCDCWPCDPVPATVLDPFGGSGTTGEVALSLRRSSVLVELNEAYCKLIRKRLSRAQVPLFTV